MRLIFGRIRSGVKKRKNEVEREGFGPPEGPRRSSPEKVVTGRRTGKEEEGREERKRKREKSGFLTF